MLWDDADRIKPSFIEQ